MTEKIQMICQISCLGILAGISILDINFRKIPMEILVLMNVSAIVYQMAIREEDLIVIAGGITVGGVFLFVSKVTGESLGYGDSLGILALGIYLGLWKVIEILAGAFFLLVLCSIFVLIKKKMSRKCTLPFYPFLAASYMIWLILQI